MKRKRGRMLAAALISALVISSLPAADVQAAKKTAPKLSRSKVSLKAGSRKKITVKSVKKVKVKSVKWSVNKKGKKIVRLTKKSKKSMTIKAIKKGKAVVTAKIRTRKKTYTRTVKVTVTKKKAAGTGGTGVQSSAEPVKTPAAVPSASAPSATKMPVSPEEPQPAPTVYGNPGETAEYSRERSNHTLDIDAEERLHEISDMLFGVFIEDINFAADGGLYAEMVQNRSFEFTEVAAGNEKHGWNDVGIVSAAVVKNDSSGCLNANNPNYMVMENKSNAPAGIANKGFLDGMSVNRDAKYKFSVWAKGLEGYTGPIHAAITEGSTILAAADIPALTSEWTEYELELTPSKTTYTGVKLQVTIDRGKAAVDMVSLFPEDTYENRENGLRKDLAEKLADLKPAFLRFPGGCVTEGKTLDIAYDWKASVGADKNGEPLKFNGTYGDVAARKQCRNHWSNESLTDDQNPSFMTYGLGFYEYFLLAEDMGAVGVPVVNCGISCMIPGNPQITTGKDYQRYIQDALDLVEFCRGDESTKWGAVRIAMGHKEPFQLKYIGIGNEQWGKDFYEHYEGFVDAFHEAKKKNPEMYGDIELMYSSGVCSGEDAHDYNRGNYFASYQEAQNWLNSHPGKTIKDFAGVVDHHYYNDPAWFYNHTDYYDEKNYSRTELTGTKYGGGLPVFLGEYASRSNTWNSALSEAAYMTGLERNGDIVRMAAYAPLFGNLTALHWAPDLIWFNNHTSTASVNYYVQKAFANNAGTTLLRSSLAGTSDERRELKGRIGVGTWNTAAFFDNVKITSNENGAVLAYDNFDSEDNLRLNWEKASDGNWSVQNGKLVQSSTSTNTAAYGTTGSTVYFGDPNWKNYTFTVDAVKTAGTEGFLIPIAVKNSSNNYFWNIGGWNNTVSCLQQVKDGIKSDQIPGTARPAAIQNGTVYRLKVVVTGDHIKCYINDTLYIDHTVGDASDSECYQVVSTDKTGDIIVKIVNVTGYAKTLAIDIKGADYIGDTAKLDLAAGDSLAADNILGQKEVVTLKTMDVKGIKKQFNYTVPKYSVSVLRVKTQ